MWDKVLGYGQKIISLSRRVDEQDERLSLVKDNVLWLQQEVRDTGEALRYLHDEQKRERGRSEARQEPLVLRLENTLLRAGLGVLPASLMDALPTGDAG